MLKNTLKVCAIVLVVLSCTELGLRLRLLIKTIDKRQVQHINGKYNILFIGDGDTAPRWNKNGEPISYPEILSLHLEKSFPGKFKIHNMAIPACVESSTIMDELTRAFSQVKPNLIISMIKPYYFFSPNLEVGSNPLSQVLIWANQLRVVGFLLAKLEQYIGSPYRDSYFVKRAANEFFATKNCHQNCFNQILKNKMREDFISRTDFGLSDAIEYLSTFPEDLSTIVANLKKSRWTPDELRCIEDYIRIALTQNEQIIKDETASVLGLPPEPFLICKVSALIKKNTSSSQFNNAATLLNYYSNIYTSSFETSFYSLFTDYVRLLGPYLSKNVIKKLLNALPLNNPATAYFKIRLNATQSLLDGNFNESEKSFEIANSFLEGQQKFFHSGVVNSKFLYRFAQERGANVIMLSYPLTSLPGPMRGHDFNNVTYVDLFYPFFESIKSNTHNFTDLFENLGNFFGDADFGTTTIKGSAIISNELYHHVVKSAGL